jgi:hypothetical protein
MSSRRVSSINSALHGGDYFMSGKIFWIGLEPQYILLDQGTSTYMKFFGLARHTVAVIAAYNTAAYSLFHRTTETNTSRRLHVRR